MSVMLQSLAGLQEIAEKVTSNAVTTVVDASAQALYVPWMQVSETNGGTQNLTVELYDGTTSYYLGSGGSTWKAKAVTAKQSLSFSDIVVPRGWKIRVTSSDASGYFDVVGVRSTRIG